MCLMSVFVGQTSVSSYKQLFLFPLGCPDGFQRIAKSLQISVAHLTASIEADFHSPESDREEAIKRAKLPLFLTVMTSSFLKSALRTSAKTSDKLIEFRMTELILSPIGFLAINSFFPFYLSPKATVSMTTLFRQRGG